jgi:hypothetical protein
VRAPVTISKRAQREIYQKLKGQVKGICVKIKGLSAVPEACFKTALT